MVEPPLESPTPVEGQGDEYHRLFREGSRQGLRHEGGHEPGRLRLAVEFQLLRQGLSAAAIAKGGEGLAGRAPRGLEAAGERSQRGAAGGTEILRPWTA